MTFQCNKCAEGWAAPQQSLLHVRQMDAKMTDVSGYLAHGTGKRDECLSFSGTEGPNIGLE